MADTKTGWKDTKTQCCWGNDSGQPDPAGRHSDFGGKNKIGEKRKQKNSMLCIRRRQEGGKPRTQGIWKNEPKGMPAGCPGNRVLPHSAPGRGGVPGWTGPLRHPSALVGGAGRCGQGNQRASIQPCFLESGFRHLFSPSGPVK